MNSLFFSVVVRALVSTYCVLRNASPVRCVFFLVLIFLHASAMLFMLRLEYFALLQLLVYIGALAVMFLFVVMLLDIPSTEITAHQRRTVPATLALLLLFFFFLFLTLWQPAENSPLSPSVVASDSILTSRLLFNESWNKVSNRMSNLTMLGISIYGVYVDLLVLASLLLLVAMVGAVALTLKRRVNAPAHDSFAQHNVDFQKIVLQIQK